MVAVALVFVVDDYTATQVGTLGAYICVCLGLTVLIGGNGQISLGHAALMAIGAYTMAKFLPQFEDDFGMASIPMILVGLALATLVTTAVGIVIGLAAARLRGPYLAGATLATRRLGAGRHDLLPPHVQRRAGPRRSRSRGARRTRRHAVGQSTASSR